MSGMSAKRAAIARTASFLFLPEGLPGSFDTGLQSSVGCEENDDDDSGLVNISARLALYSAGSGEIEVLFAV